MLKQYIQEAIQKVKTPKKSCSCGCGGCSDSQPKLALLESKTPISEGLRYHIENDISLQENVFRIGSKKYLQLFAEARMLNEWGNISLDENSKFLIENTDIGKFGILEGQKVPLDLPMLNEWNLQEAISTQERKEMEEYIAAMEDEIPDSLHSAIADEIGTNDWSMGIKRLKDDQVQSIYNDMIDARTNESVNESKKKKKKDPPIGKPMRSSSGGKAYKVYVRDPKTKKVKTVRFGSGGLRAKIKNPKARSAFSKRHDCPNKKDRTKASYWSCNLPRYAPALGLGPKMNTFW